MRIPCPLIIPLLFLTVPCAAVPLNDLERLGKRIFFDPTLSSPPGQSCSSCHEPATGFTGPDSQVNAGPAAYEGAVHGRHGKRKPPSAAYATQAPALHPDPEEDILVGGNFWNGRATGWLLGNPAADQAQQPFLNPVEQNLVDASVVVEKVCEGANGEALRVVFGQNVCGRTVEAFMHNGSLKSLEQVMHFYNTRDTKPRCEGLDNPRPAENCWPAPEVEENVNTEELGDLGLTGEEWIDAVVNAVPPEELIRYLRYVFDRMPVYLKEGRTIDPLLPWNLSAEQIMPSADRG
jgi:cytochrome c peroxidase